MPKEARIYNGEKDSLFNKWCWENWTATYEGITLEHFITPYRKTQIKCKTRNHKTPRRKHRTLFDRNCNNIFFICPKAKEAKVNINKWDLIKLKSFCTAKETIDNMKGQPTEWEKNICK